MRFFACLLLQVLLLVPIGCLAADRSADIPPSNESPPITEAQRASVIKSYARLPLYFTENKGQVNKEVKFTARGPGRTIFFTPKGLTLTLTQRAGNLRKDYQGGSGRIRSRDKPALVTESVSLAFSGALDDPKLIAKTPLPGHVNYFIGNNPSKWRTSVPTYRGITYENIYSGIDARFYGNNEALEYDIIVRPGASPEAIKLTCAGVRALGVKENGDLEIRLGHGGIIEKKPRIYQVVGGRKAEVEGSYRVFKGKDGDFSYGFDVASYDRTKDLIIDPVLIYSTYLGGISLDAGLGIAVDAEGAAYVTGYTLSPDFPVVAPLQRFGGNAYTDAFVTKINPAGDAIVYSTYIGGTNADYGSDIAVDTSGAVYITGSTFSLDYPLATPIQAVHGGVADVIITKLNSAGNSIVYSTFLGGSDEDWGLGIALDSTGAAYVTGYALSTDYPVFNALQPLFGGGFIDSFITKIDPTGTALVYSTYLGGNSGEHGNDIAVDATGAVYATGQTWSTDFPLGAPIQSALSGIDDAYVTKIDPTGSSFLFSTYLGGTGEDSGNSIALDASGAVYVAGYTSSTDFPVSPAGSAIQGYLGGGFDAFLTKIDALGASYLYSTYLGGSGIDKGFSIALDASGAAYVTGQTFSTDFPLVNAVQSLFGGMDDGFVLEVAPDGASLVYSTFLGGTDSDNGFAITGNGTGEAYVTGFTFSTDFPLLAPLAGFNGGTADAFITRLGPETLPAVSLLIRPDAPGAVRGTSFGYTINASNTTTTDQCFQYWENVTLPDGTTYPRSGFLTRPTNMCLAPGAVISDHHVRAIPVTAYAGTYVFNAFIGNAFPNAATISSADLIIITTGSGTKASPHSWRVIK